MLKALRSGSSGLNAQQVKVDTVANNLANMNTTGFKKSRVEFSELLRQGLEPQGIPVAPGAGAVTGGTGVMVEKVVNILEPGSIIDTGRPLDLAVQGEGFFKVLMAGDREGFTRDGNFSVDLEGNLVTASGHRLAGVKLSPNYEKIYFDNEGMITTEASGETSEAGQITLYRFPRADSLLAIGENIFISNPASQGEVLSGKPGSEGFGALRQGGLEMANVDLVDEMTGLIEAQRAYGFSSRAVRTADEMWGMANNIRK